MKHEANSLFCGELVNFPRSPERGFVEARSYRASRFYADCFPRSPERGFVEARLDHVLPMFLRIFPRSPERGFVEAVPPAQIQRIEDWTFRAHPSAASLKRTAPAEPQNPIKSFPRSPERGFVEAVESRTNNAATLPFRAHPSAASLKPGSGASEVSRYLSFRAHPSAASLKRHGAG